MTIYIGIDPGISGAIALVAQDGTLVAVHDMPTMQITVGKGKRSRISEGELAALFDDIAGKNSVAMCMIEDVGPRPMDGAVAAFNFGASFGAIKQAVASAMLPYATITPAKWKRIMGLDSDKAKSRQMAQRTWPDKAALFSRVKDDGRAEAALLARHAWLSLHNAMAA